MITINNEHEKTMRVSKTKTITMKFYMTMAEHRARNLDVRPF